MRATGPTLTTPGLLLAGLLVAGLVLLLLGRERLACLRIPGHVLGGCDRIRERAELLLVLGAELGADLEHLGLDPLDLGPEPRVLRPTATLDDAGFLVRPIAEGRLGLGLGGGSGLEVLSAEVVEIRSRPAGGRRAGAGREPRGEAVLGR